MKRYLEQFWNQGEQKLTNRTATRIYEDFVRSNQNVELAKNLYDTPPTSFGNNHNRLLDVLEKYRETVWHSEERMKKLQKALIKTNKDMGCLTQKVQHNIQNIHNGAIESAHQSVVIGGPTFILNKAATAERIASLNSTKDHKLSPFFCVADYDIVQNELTHMRTPLFGSGGTLVSLSVPEGYEFSPVSAIPLPEYDWYEQAEEDIRAGYSPMFKNLDRTAKLLFEERLETALTIVRSSYESTRTLGDWASQILGQLFNVYGNLGLPILKASDPEIRELWALGMELLLNNDTRKRFVEFHTEASELIESNGYDTGIGQRGKEYVPFYYECSNPSCNRSRTELMYDLQGNTALLRGKCMTCGEVIEIEVSANDPDLSEHAHNLSPRVDSRQIIIDTSVPVLAHAGGPGETAYYAQVIPAAKKLGYPFPLYVKYPRVFYNTPWNEALGKELKEIDFKILHSSDLFKPMGKVTRFRKKERIDEMNEQLVELSSVIRGTYDSLNNSLAQLVERIDNLEGKASDEDFQMKLQLERYLSWVYGQYAEGKSAQESSWAWIDWAINAGLADLFGPYQRAYVNGMKHGSTLFINFSV